MANDHTELDNQPHQQSQHRAPPSRPSGLAHLMNPELSSQAGPSNSGNLSSPSRQQNNAHIPQFQQTQDPQAPPPQQLPNSALPQITADLEAWKTPPPILPADDMPVMYRHRENVAIEKSNDSSIRWTILYMRGESTGAGKRLRQLVGYTMDEMEDFLSSPIETRKEDWAYFPRFLKKDLADLEKAEKERKEAKADKERQEREQRKLKPVQIGFETKLFSDAPPISGAGNSATIPDIYKIHFSVGLCLPLAFFISSVMRLAVYQDRIKTRIHHKQNTKDATVVDETGTIIQLQLIPDLLLTVAQYDECADNMMATMEAITSSAEAVGGGPTNKTAELLKHFSYFANISHRVERHSVWAPLELYLRNLILEHEVRFNADNYEAALGEKYRPLDIAEANNEDSLHFTPHAANTPSVHAYTPSYTTPARSLAISQVYQDYGRDYEERRSRYSDDRSHYYDDCYHYSDDRSRRNYDPPHWTHDEPPRRPYRESPCQSQFL
ncbi:hypothetical protein BD626DRAFT_590400 [Schizophyllum amplum]|uniref:Uncharacterized protein n=1 Tax=Schizophyllum amplum TaxID=97359 RepID=A0A550CXM0_9AGAR|nr:hypothetical protein BD626DRAFT_590400 [Auriculariopsis ampla]